MNQDVTPPLSFRKKSFTSLYKLYQKLYGHHHISNDNYDDKLWPVCLKVVYKKGYKKVLSSFQV